MLASIFLNKVFLIIVALILTVIGIVFFVVPVMQHWIASVPVWVDFVFFYFIIFGIIEVVLFLLLPMKLKSFRFAMGGTLLIMAFDLVLPSYAVDLSGRILSSETVGYFGSIDYVLAFYWHGLGISGPLLYFCTYVISFAVLLIVALGILGGPAFIKALITVIR